MPVGSRCWCSTRTACGARWPPPRRRFTRPTPSPTSSRGATRAPTQPRRRRLPTRSSSRPAPPAAAPRSRSPPRSAARSRARWTPAAWPSARRQPRGPAVRSSCSPTRSARRRRAPCGGCWRPCGRQPTLAWDCICTTRATPATRMPWPDWRRAWTGSTPASADSAAARSRRGPPATSPPRISPGYWSARAPSHGIDLDELGRISRVARRSSSGVRRPACCIAPAGSRLRSA